MINKLTTFFFGLTLALNANPVFSQNILINEVQTDNVNTIADEDNAYPAWIELYNNSDQTINLQDYGLSKDPDHLFNWTFPYLPLAPHDYLLVFASAKNRTDYFEYHWETVVNQGDLWKYKVGDNSISTQWIQDTYNDTSWPEGESGFGYGDNDDATILGSDAAPIRSVYIRKKFNVEQPEDVVDLLLHMDYDDGFVAYLNGKEIVRANMGTAGSTVTYTTLANGNHEAVMYKGNTPEQFNLKHAVPLLKQGTNILAIEGHNTSATSSDLSLIPFLTLLMKDAPPLARGISPMLTLPAITSVLHANFKLEGDENTLFLTSPDKEQKDIFIANNVPQNDSKGLDQQLKVVAFSTPTPGAENTSGTVFSKLDDVRFSVESGMYQQPITVALSSNTPEGIIRYTTDGQNPDQRSKIYTTPLKVDATAIIKAVVSYGRYIPSDCVSRTYLFDKTHTLPVISITTLPDDLFNTNTGIYMLGNFAEISWPYVNANFWKNTSKPALIEYFESDGTFQFKAKAQLSIAGKTSRAYAQKSLSFELETNQSSYELFPNSPVSSIKNFTLSNGDDEWAHTLFTEAFLQDLGATLSLRSPSRQACVTYINGEYWGIQELKEAYNIDYFAKEERIDQNKSAILAYDLDLKPVEIHGNTDDYDKLWNLANSNVNLSNSQITSFAKDINFKNFINYFIFQIYIGNTDWPGSNQLFWNGGSSESKWQWVLTDLDHGFGISFHGDKNYAFYDPEAYLFQAMQQVLQPSKSTANPYYSTLLLRRMLTNPIFKTRFINTFADNLNYFLSPDRVIENIDAYEAMFKTEIQDHYERWKTDLIGNYRNEWKTPEEWSFRVDALRDYAKKRHPEMFQQITSAFSLPKETHTITLNSKLLGGGQIKINSLNISVFPWSGNYFQTVPIQVTAIPNPGYRFDGWEETSSTDAFVNLALTENTTLTARFIKDADWTYAPIVINEIQFKSDGLNGSGEWIELFNAGKQSQDMSSWLLSITNATLSFEFPDNFSLQAGESIVISQNINAFIKSYPTVYNVIGESDFELNDVTGTLMLHSNLGDLIDSVSYSNSAPWPKVGVPATSIALKSPFADNTMALNWQVSTNDGTPGQANGDYYTPLNKMTIQLNAEAFPNPFRDNVFFRISLENAKQVNITVYDQSGRCVYTKTYPWLIAGEHFLEWDGCRPNGTPLNSGLYVCCISTPDGTKTIKINKLY